MCEYDGSYEPISESLNIKTRKIHECGCCLKDWPPGTIMDRHFGKTEGEISTTYTCPVCKFAVGQDDGTPLHFCWGDLWDSWGADPDPRPTYDYIKACLANTTAPTAHGLAAYKAALQLAEEV